MRPWSDTEAQGRSRPASFTGPPRRRYSHKEPIIRQAEPQHSQPGTVHLTHIHRWSRQRRLLTDHLTDTKNSQCLAADLPDLELSHFTGP